MQSLQILFLAFRFCDFVVNEIDQQGEVVRLTNLQEKEEVDFRTDLSVEKFPSYDKLPAEDRKLLGQVRHWTFFFGNTIGVTI